MKCLILFLVMIHLIFAKKYERCELAKELDEKHNVDMVNVGMLVCIAEWYSALETGKNGSGIYGLFQLNGDYWCSKDDDTEDGCNMKCTDLIDDDITDDVKCVKQIISVQGLDAWKLTKQCLPILSEIIEQCFSTELDSSEIDHLIVKDD